MAFFNYNFCSGYMYEPYTKENYPDNFQDKRYMQQWQATEPMTHGMYQLADRNYFVAQTLTGQDKFKQFNDPSLKKDHIFWIKNLYQYSIKTYANVKFFIHETLPAHDEGFLLTLIILYSFFKHA